ncbi:formin BNR1-like [Lotus japonicus]|uniref:formin BNR1-like n=1 Tax=Lotus japonicus TaxID=34305 RepID=UPI00258A6EEC|nr:formin BNR1-like [Lotus japonicus]
MVVTEEEISEALQSLLRESNPRRPTFTTLNQVLHQLQTNLGHDLSHKLDFIAAQINLLLAQQQPPPQRQQPHQHQPPPPKDHFALHQNPNYPHGPVTSSFQTFSSNPVPAVAEAARTEAPPPPPSPPHVPRNEAPKDSTQTKPKRRGGPGGLNKLCGVSPELQVIVGQPALPRTEIVKQLWAYIRKNNLQDPSNKRKIICNDELRVVFETDCTDMFKMNKLLAKHIIALEPSKQPAPKRQKVDVESGTKSAEPAPSVIISDTLANFFGVTGREMLQSEVLRRIWEYIKVKQLEDPVNPMAIMCDAKLQEIFGCESISALGIPEVLGRHHIFRRS